MGNLSAFPSAGITIELGCFTYAAAKPHRNRSLAAKAEAACFVYANARYVSIPCCFVLGIHSIHRGQRTLFSFSSQLTKKTNRAKPNGRDPMMGTIQCLSFRQNSESSWFWGMGAESGRQLTSVLAQPNRTKTCLWGRRMSRTALSTATPQGAVVGLFAPIFLHTDSE